MASLEDSYTFVYVIMCKPVTTELKEKECETIKEG